MESREQEFSFRHFFIPLTTSKAIHFIIIFGIIVYFNMLFNQFVWDDIGYILKNPDLHKVNIPVIFKNDLYNSQDHLIVFIALYHAILYSLFGANAFISHVLQLLFHITNSILVFYLFKRLFYLKLSLFLSLIFLVHPAQVEAVSFISATSNPLFFLFGISALLISMSNTVSRKKYFAIFILLFLSVFMKETGILFVLVIVLQKILFKFKKKDIVNILILSLALVICYIVTRFTIGGIHLMTTKASTMPISALNLSERLLNFPAIFLYYIKTYFYPLNLAINQQWTITKIGFSTFSLPIFIDIIFIFSIGVFCIYFSKSNQKIYKCCLFFSLWYLIGILMHSQIIPIDMTVAERYFYFPMVGILGITGCGLIILKELFYKYNNKQFLVYLAIIILSLLSVRTIIRNANWYDDITLFTHDAKVYDNSDIENNIGNYYINLRNYKEAIVHLEKSAKIMPTEVNYYNLGFAYEKSGNLARAKEIYQKSITLHKYPDREINNLVSETITNRLAYVMLMLNENQQTLDFIKENINKYPDNGYLWEYMAISEYKLNDKTNAKTHIAIAKKYINSSEIDPIYNTIYNDDLSPKSSNLPNIIKQN